MYREEMNFDNMKQLIAMGAFSVVMCIVAMFTMNGCAQANHMDADSIMVDSLDSVLVDSLDTIACIDYQRNYQKIANYVHMDSVCVCEKK